MGVIKDGTISGCLPSDNTFAVHFPGYPSSTSRAVETLGGSEGILKARSSELNKLELRFRPEDPYCHPAFGELRYSSNNLLLKISKTGRKCDDALKDQVQNDDKICADIIARVPEAYHFEGMVDYQHVLAAHANAIRSKKRNWTEAEKGGPKDICEELMMLVPPLFSAKDFPTTIALNRRSVPSSSKRKQEGTTEQVVVEDSLALDFRIKDILDFRFPLLFEIPKKVNWEEKVTQGSDEWEKQVAVSKLFDERPIWPKRSLHEQLLNMGINLGDVMLKRSCWLLVNVAYYFNNGPFLKFWIRKGYDPRQDPESCIYQGIDFRVPQQLQSYCDSVAPDRLQNSWEDLCAFRVFPCKCHTQLQLFELADEYIQQEIRNSPRQKACTFRTGWFMDHVLDRLRLCVMVRYLSVYPKSGAEKLLKQASARFERSKRMQFDEQILKPEKEKSKKGHTGNERCNEIQETEDDDEEEEIEDIIEEEFDAFEPLELAADDGEDSLQSYSYPDMENVSRTYLQELFGSFPSTEALGLDMQNDDGSEGEYQIYEQDSDDGDDG